LRYLLFVAAWGGVSLLFSGTGRAQCGSPPNPQADWSGYQRWCSCIGGEFYNDHRGTGCDMRRVTFSSSSLHNNLETMRTTQDGVAQELNELNQLMAELTGWDRAVLEALSPEERTSLEKAFKTVTERYVQAVARHQAVDRKIERLEGELTALQIEVAKEAHRLTQIQVDLSARRHLAAVTQRRIGVMKRELAVASEALELLESFATGQMEAAAKARRAYWDTAAELFREKGLGLPRDYLEAIEAGPVVTQRRTQVIHEGGTHEMVHTTYHVPIVSSVRGQFTSPLVRRRTSLQTLAPHRLPSRVAAPLEPTAENLKLLLHQLGEKTKQCEASSRRVDQLLIEGDRAKWQLRQTLAERQRYEKEIPPLESEIDRLKREAALYRWELDVRTAKARKYIMDSFRAWQEGQRWQALKKILGLVLHDDKLAATVRDELHFAYDIVEGDLDKVPAAVAYDQQYEELHAKLRADYEGFAKSILEIQDDPLSPKIKWIKGLVEAVKGE
jgi:predicted  nucleic acid-binding Zn-ribbon protein